MKRKFVFITLSLVLTLITLPGCVQLLRNGSVDRVKQKQPAYSTIPSDDMPIFELPAPSGVPLLPVPESAFQVCCHSGTWGSDEQIWGENGFQKDKQALLSAIDKSLRYLGTPAAATAYRRYRVASVTRSRVKNSLKRFRELVLKSNSPQELQASVKREFVFYQSVGKDGFGNVLFTAYYEPVYAASRYPTPEYRYPIYRRPSDLASWPRPHPTRLELEGADGLQGSKGKLRGLELFWLRDRMEAFLAQIEGSARLQLTDGKETTVGYAGNTAYNYISIGRELANDGKLPLKGMTMPMILEYFKQHPEELDNYLPRNHSFVFFRENHGQSATGSIGVSLTAERSIATDKSLMPPGALALIYTSIPFINAMGQMEHRTVTRYVLDQDTGGAITGPARVDYFLGSGKEAGDRAGVTVSHGQLYYLLLKK